MFSVLFEVHPKPDQWDAYLGLGKMLKPELEQIDGFVDNIRYRSLRREGWLLSLSGWRDEKALVPLRDLSRLSFADRPVDEDTKVPDGQALHEQRLDETETGDATTITLIDAKRPPEWVKQSAADDVAKWLGPMRRAWLRGMCSTPS
jgi:hypothetical protein